MLLSLLIVAAITAVRAQSAAGSALSEEQNSATVSQIEAPSSQADVASCRAQKESESTNTSSAEVAHHPDASSTVHRARAKRIHREAQLIAAKSKHVDSKGKKSTKSGSADSKDTDDSESNSRFSGNISWYGIPFHGRKTASGSIYDMNKLTCAHRSLPFGTRVLIENPKNGNSCTVEVTDRGPYVYTRVMDVSREAAKELGTLTGGIAYVNCLIVPATSSAETKPAPASAGQSQPVAMTAEPPESASK